MATITLKGNACETSGELPAVGSKAPAFTLVKPDLSEIALSDLAGKKVVLNIFPSVDTPVCAASVRRFNEAAASLEDTVVVCVSADLPFAQGRFCGAEGIENVESGSDFREAQFARDYGVRITTGPLAGVMARAVVVLDGSGTVVHAQLVPEVAEDADFDAALAALN